jgi:hypothetical protein
MLANIANRQLTVATIAADPGQKYTSRHNTISVGNPGAIWVNPAPVEWFFLVVGLILVLRYLWILDDSFIYYRYVDNLLFLHRGLVFNQGEFVEGYSSPLWLLVLIAFRALHLDYWTITATIAVIAYCAFGYIGVLTNRLLYADRSGSPVSVPLVYLCTAYCVTTYFSSGSESPLMQLAAAAIALHAFFPRSRAIQVLLGAMPLVRNEYVVPLAVTIACSWFLMRRVPWALIVSATVFGTSWLVFRIYYYADFFPTPFYLKDKTAIAQGLHYVRNCFEPYNFHWLLASALIVLVILWKFRDLGINLRVRGLMWAVAASSVPYVIKVGGDMMHYRLLAFPFCLGVLSLGGLAERLFSIVRIVPSPSGRSIIAFVFGVGCFMNYPRFLSSHPIWGHEERKLDHGISDAPWHRHHPDLVFDESRKTQDRVRLGQYEVTKGKYPTVAVELFCATMFVEFNKQFVHAYGLTDPVLARIDTPEERPGHKSGLYGPALDLARIRARYRGTTIGLVSRAIRARAAPKWMLENERSIRLIEARIYNFHSFLPNFTQAFRRIDSIKL